MCTLTAVGVYAGYIRVSRVGDRFDTLISPRLQEEAIRAWAKGAGHELVMLSPELDASGGDDTRPVLLDAIERIERGEIEGIAVWKLDRFARNLASSIRFLERIEAAGGQLRSTSEPMDTSTVAGRQVRNIFFSIAQGEREQRAEDFERSKADAISRGVYISGHVPLGYRKDADRRLEPDPATAPVVREAFVKRAAGNSWRQIADYIAGELGRPFYGPTVSRMIANPVYLGVARQGSHVNRDAHDGLVTLSQWENAQKVHPRPARGTQGTGLLAGIARCSGCSWRMTSTVKRGAREYRCRRRGARGSCPAPATISAGILEPIVEATVLAWVASLEVTATRRTEDTTEAQQALEEAVSERDTFARAVQAADVGAEHVAEGIKERADAVERAQRKLIEARLASDPAPDHPGTVAEVWPTLSVDDRNHVLRRSLSVVWVKRGRGPDRVRVVDRAGGHGLSVQGRPADPVTLDWDSELEGEIGITLPQDLAKADGEVTA